MIIFDEIRSRIAHTRGRHLPLSDTVYMRSRAVQMATDSVRMRLLNKASINVRSFTSTHTNAWIPVMARPRISAARTGQYCVDLYETIETHSGYRSALRTSESRTDSRHVFQYDIRRLQRSRQKPLEVYSNVSGYW